MNEEMIAKLQKAKTVEEIIAIAKEYGKEVTAEKAQELLDKISSAAGELSDDALSAVAGGVLSTPSRNGSEAFLASKMPGYKAGREWFLHVPFSFRRHKRQSSKIRKDSEQRAIIFSGDVYTGIYLSKNLLLSRLRRPLGRANSPDRQIQSEMTCVQDICR